MQVLCLEPFGGGSHAALWQGWKSYSSHTLTILDLPAVHWKWRSRHASLSLALAANQLLESGLRIDLVVCSSMLNLPEWRGLADHFFRSLPAIVYFHENQFTYPLSPGQTRDFHYGYSQVLTAIAADQVWFNSAFHRDEFSEAACHWLRRMPDYKHLELFESAIAKSLVLPPGIEPTGIGPAGLSQPGDDPKYRTENRQQRIKTSPPVIGWVARWEHDKRPDLFVSAMEQLIAADLDFRLILLGQQFSSQPDSLRRLEQVAQDRIEHCGFVDSRDAYWRLLSQIDIVVSTADHEFFGLGIVESVAAGAIPLLPNRLAYPEVFGLREHPDRACFFYEDLDDLRNKLMLHLAECTEPRAATCLPVEHYYWRNLVERYDQALSRFD